MTEPTFDPAEAGKLNFRGRRAAPAVRHGDAIDNLWWQIALGGFLALMAHSVVTSLYARWETHRAIQQLNAEMASATKQLRRQVQHIESAAPVVDYGPEPLRDGERCINGRRFERVENGWRQVNLPC